MTVLAVEGRNGKRKDGIMPLRESTRKMTLPGNSHGGRSPTVSFYEELKSWEKKGGRYEEDGSRRQKKFLGNLRHSGTVCK